jgi:hypothetical protein
LRKGVVGRMRSEIRLPTELAALREIRRRAARHCAARSPQKFQTTLLELKEALDRLDMLEREAGFSLSPELLPPPNVYDRGE